MLTAVGPGVSGSGTTKLTITVTLVEVNNALATLQDLEKKAGSDTITVEANVANGATAVATIAVNLPPADFNSDGKSDAAWQNDTAEPAIWLIDGAGVIGSGTLVNPGPSWHIKGSGGTEIISGTGSAARADILWQNDSGEVAVWTMNGTALASGNILGNPGPSWHAVRTGDFNGNNRLDILFQNTSGEVALWETDGTTVTGSASLGNPGPAWHVVGTGDFNNDLRSDILWRNDDGDVAIWEMNGTAVIAGSVLGNPGPSWYPVGTGDFNGDGNADILWQNSDGGAAIWELNGTMSSPPQASATRARAGTFPRLATTMATAIRTSSGRTAMDKPSSGR